MESLVEVHPYGIGQYLAVIQPGDVIRRLVLSLDEPVVELFGPIDPDDLVHQALVLLLESWIPEELPHDLDLADLAVADPDFLPELRARLTGKNLLSVRWPVPASGKRVFCDQSEWAGAPFGGRDVKSVRMAAVARDRARDRAE